MTAISSRKDLFVQDQVEKHIGCVANYLQLALYRTRSVAQLELSFETAIEAIQLGVVPQQVGLFTDLRAPDHAVLRG